MKKDIDILVENFFAPKPAKLNSGALYKLIEELMNEQPAQVDVTDAGTRFVLSLPSLGISEAWGDPETMSRQQVNKIFSQVRGGSDLAKRIQYVNDYLDPKKARRKTSTPVIINGMMIIESLKAALNHFNESSAGFVFESFMAALTGGHQQKERVGGTLPIEDFVAFSQFGGKSVPVSLKLLSRTTYIKGSFTNLIDYLFIRGESAIKYLIAYKTIEAGGAVGKLMIYDFDITRSNLIDFLVKSSSMSRAALGNIPPEEYKAAIASGDLTEIAKVFVRAPGYTDMGQLHQTLQGETGSPDDTKDIPHTHPLDAQQVSESQNTFHLDEKASLLYEGSLLTEGVKGDTQWMISKTQMESLGAEINLSLHGEMDFSEQRIHQIAGIYAKKLGNQVLELLESVQSLTNNIGTYFSERLRKSAMRSGHEAINDASTIQTNLIQQVTSEPAEP